MKVRIGRFHSGAEESIGVHAELDIERLVESRAFIQASSGFGKSYLLCELIEATHGHIQQIIIDPEGEFSLLRKDHDFVIAAAHGGDAIAHPRTAALLATRLLETKASAILDIYDVKPRERHEFVRNFLVSMMEARKELWHPVLVFLDEAHLFCPEKGMGESEATDAVIDLAGRGRKRGFTLVAATQRIGKFNKSALAELHNKFIGYASLDTDVKRAAFELGKTPKDALDAFRTLKPGDFYAFGPALRVPAPCLFKGTLPQTKLPKAGHRKLVAPPKPTDKIRALLPQLADLPREVEQKAKTEAELRKDLADALREIGTLKKAQEFKDKNPTAFKAAPDPDLVSMKEVERQALTHRRNFKAFIEDAMKQTGHAMQTWHKGLLDTLIARIENGEKFVLVPPKSRHVVKVNLKPVFEVTQYAKHAGGSAGGSHSAVTGTSNGVILDDPVGREELSGPERRIIDAIVWLETATGGNVFTNGAVAFVAKYSPTGSSYEVPRAKLTRRGYIVLNGGMLNITDAGRAVAEAPTTAVTREELHSRVCSILDGPQKRILIPLLEAWPEWLTNEQVAEKANYSPTASSYEVPRAKLTRVGLIELSNGRLRARDFLFP